MPSTEHVGICRPGQPPVNAVSVEIMRHLYVHGCAASGHGDSNSQTEV